MILLSSKTNYQQQQIINMSTEQQFKAWAVFEPKGRFSEWSYTPRPLGSNDIDIDITHCGICYSDIHTIDCGWGNTTYPVVPGHEIVGTVKQIGTGVTRVKVGQRVAVGAQVGSCHSCDSCDEHYEAYCLKAAYTYNGKYPDGTKTYGGYAKNIRLEEQFVFGVPENLKSEEVAPLLCGGVTVYSPLKYFGAGPGKKVGIVGIGGLGHLGLRFARALGAEVYALSTSSSKEEESKRLGAHHFINTNDTESLAKYANTLDLIICTANGINMDYSPFLNILRRDGTFTMVGAPEAPITIKFFPLLLKRLKFAGSLIGSPSEIEEMLQLASKNNFAAEVQVWPISKVEEAIEGCRQGKPRYRYVLEL